MLIPDNDTSMDTLITWALAEADKRIDGKLQKYTEDVPLDNPDDAIAAVAENYACGFLRMRTNPADAEAPGWFTIGDMQLEVWIQAHLASKRKFVWE